MTPSTAKYGNAVDYNTHTLPVFLSATHLDVRDWLFLLLFTAVTVKTTP